MYAQAIVIAPDKIEDVDQLAWISEYENATNEKFFLHVTDGDESHIRAFYPVPLMLDEVVARMGEGEEILVAHPSDASRWLADLGLVGRRAYYGGEAVYSRAEERI